MFVLLLLVYFLSFSRSVEVKKVCYEVVENVLYCKSVITEKSLVPQVCGKCELEVMEDKLYIKPSTGCPKYDALACQLRSGELFLINNLSCKPVSENPIKEEKDKSKKKKVESKTYRVKVMEEFCINLLKKKFDVIKESRGEALIRASSEEIRNLPHCVYSYEEE
ncbi:hypothetical protein BCF55_0822 [Hydrogenivirga caldilitoris]|uniref:Uncharacterized protein n=1 Tax=Hydrogenivirga caldilitoris TaxID=246264 RepID=A0A497XNK6_9AQUI|nr:hypothetical protein [Hydrogenivirga caldilitoris]RLJ70546.1 hypothetical protein BCF55_0822 [Hydrogenivirga caldilitoris]